MAFPERAGRFAGRVALITGAASGIGRATAIQLAREGADLALTDLHEDLVGPVAFHTRNSGSETLALPLDIREEGQWEAAIAATIERFERLDVLIANAGITHGRRIVDTPFEEWRRVMAVNLDGAFLSLKHGMRQMAAQRPRGGAIVLTGSISGLKAAPGAGPYAASKAALHQLARAAALEGAPEGIRVNAVAPGGVETPIWRDLPFFQDLIREHGDEETAFAALGRMATPLQRYATADEVSAVIAFLASDEASFVTGALWPVDGGYGAT